MEENYSYPLDLDWTQEEMIKVMAMWEVLEQAYEGGLPVTIFLTKYHDFKSVIKSIGEERQLGREFEEVSGYSLYQAVQTAKGLDPKKNLKLQK